MLHSAFNKAKVVNKVGTRAAKIGADAVGALRGERKTDERGRSLKREWEKSWARNTARNVAITAAGLGVATHLKNHPEHYEELKSIKRGVLNQRVAMPVTRRDGTRGVTHVAPAPPKTKIGRKLVKISAATRSKVKSAVTALLAAKVRRTVELGYHDPAGWDVRDGRGRSARVFSPGSKPRERREKKWHERATTQRRLLTGVAAAGTIAGLAAGRAVGIKAGVRRAEASLAKKRVDAALKGAATREARAKGAQPPNIVQAFPPRRKRPRSN